MNRHLPIVSETTEATELSVAVKFPKKVERIRREARIAHYVNNYSVRTLAELIVSLEDKYGIPSAID